MIWPVTVGVLIASLLVASYTRRSDRIWSSPHVRRTALAVLVIGFVLALSLRLMPWQYLVLTVLVVVSVTSLGVAIARAYTGRRWKLMTSLLLASTIVPLVILSLFAFNRIVNPTITIEGRVVYGD